MKQFSTEDLITNLYQENSPETSAQISESIDQSWPLQEKQAVLLDAVQLLQEGWKHPRATIIEQIMAYAAKQQEGIHA